MQIAFKRNSPYKHIWAVDLAANANDRHFKTNHSAGIFSFSFPVPETEIGNLKNITIKFIIQSQYKRNL